jgi:predicted extracellular nuclease
LIAHPKVRQYGYDILHFNSPDSRGIDVALLYRKSFFLLNSAKKYKLNLVDPKTQHRRTTRDQLVVSGFLEEIELAVTVNHWPSRRGVQKRSQASRIKAAQLQLRILDSLQRTIPEGYLISMGDFNDNPSDKSVSLLVKKNGYYQGFEPLYNPMKKLFKNGIGSLAHRDRWHLFDQILVSQNWTSKQGLSVLKAAVFKPSFLINPEGKYLGYPYRNHVKGTKLYGYSDHFPVYIIVGKKN